MSTLTSPGQSAITPLSPERCRELLAGAEIGRVGWNAADGPHVLPVTYVVDAGQILFRTSPYGVLAQLVRRQPVAFEVDEFDRSTRAAWSVEVRGQAESLKQSPRLVELFRTEAVTPWAEGSRQLFICITPLSIAGRKIAGHHTSGGQR